MSSVIVPVYTSENLLQRLNVTGNFRISEVFVKTADSVDMVYGQSESCGLEDFTEERNAYTVSILKDPIQQGNRWATTSGASLTGEAAGYSEITGVNLSVDTEAGSYTGVVKVETATDNGYTQACYYAPGVGLVKEEYFIKGVTEGSLQSEDQTNSLILKSIEENKPLTVDILTYYPVENPNYDPNYVPPTDPASQALENETPKGRYMYETARTTVNFNTNDQIERYLEQALKSPGDGINGLIPEAMAINSVSLTREQIKDPNAPPDRVVTYEFATATVDFSMDFDIANPELKAATFDAIRQTFADFYWADECVISVNGTVIYPES
jgi:hypothetical protein